MSTPECTPEHSITPLRQEHATEGRITTLVADCIDRLQTEAYAEGRKDEAEEWSEVLRWCYSKLHYRSFDSMEDALMLDRIKLKLEHGL